MGPLRYRQPREADRSLPTVASSEVNSPLLMVKARYHEGFLPFFSTRLESQSLQHL